MHSEASWPRLAAAARRLAPRVTIVGAAYWAANAALAVGEVRWHILSRLIALDLRAAEAIPPLLVAKLLHVSIALTLATSS